jgi:hypothetical protein
MDNPFFIKFCPAGTHAAMRLLPSAGSRFIILGTGMPDKNPTIYPAVPDFLRLSPFSFLPVKSCLD